MQKKVFIHCEITKREFDAKVLLSATAALEGFEIYLGNILGLRLTHIPSYSIFHHKDCTPGELNLNLFKDLKKNKIYITCQDEEGGVEEKKNFFSKPPIGFFYYRFGKKSIKLVDAIFTWSNYDYKNLIKRFKNYKQKIFRTGNPRADLWSRKFENFYNLDNKKKYILVNSHTGGISLNKSFNEILETTKNAYYLNDNPGFDKFKKLWFDEYSNRTKYFYKLSSSLIKLASKFPKQKIIFRPHPMESLDKWKYIFRGCNNMIVSKENTSTYWMHKAKFLIQNGCYTSIEAANIGVDIITFVPPEIKKHVKTFTGSLGMHCKTDNELFSTVNELLKNKNKLEYLKIKKKNFKLVNERFDFPKKQSNSQKIVTVWQKITSKSEDQYNLFQELFFKYYISSKKIKYKLYKFFFKPKLDIDRKFQDISLEDVSIKIKVLNKLLNKEKKIKFKLINNQLIKFYT
jgi:surface carbohydrate biosynthesis protein